MLCLSNICVVRVQLTKWTKTIYQRCFKKTYSSTHLMLAFKITSHNYTRLLTLYMKCRNFCLLQSTALQDLFSFFYSNIFFRKSEYFYLPVSFTYLIVNYTCIEICMCIYMYVWRLLSIHPFWTIYFKACFWRDSHDNRNNLFFHVQSSTSMHVLWQ